MLHYLSSPYNHTDPIVMESRRIAACKKAAELIAKGIAVISPIAHNIAIQQVSKMDTGWDVWKDQDLAMLKACGKLLVLQLPGWESSKGIRAEVGFAIENGIPIEYIVAESVTFEDLQSDPWKSLELEYDRLIGWRKRWNDLASDTARARARGGKRLLQSEQERIERRAAIANNKIRSVLAQIDVLRSEK